MIVATEDPKLARMTLERLKTFEFESACVMHGRPIMAGAGEAFRRATFER